MSSQTKNTSTERVISEQLNQKQSLILNFTTRKRIKEIQNRECIDKVKYEENTRILSINVNKNKNIYLFMCILCTA